MAMFTWELFAEYDKLLCESKDWQFLLQYKFHGLDGYDGKAGKEIIDLFSFTIRIFRWDSTDLTAEQMAKYAISFWTCVIAFDMLVTTSNMTNHIYHGKQADYRIFKASYSESTDSVWLIFENVATPGVQSFRWNFRIVPSDFEIVDKQLDRVINVTGNGFGRKHLNMECLCKDINFNFLEHWIQEMDW